MVGWRPLASAWLDQASLELVRDQVSQYPHRFGEALARTVYEPDITMKGVYAQIECSNTHRPLRISARLRHQCDAYALFNQLEDGFQLIQFAHLMQREMHLPHKSINLPAAER